ncbi:MAG TPA: CARDB domain-containing protein [Thermoanaerobaculia bacterium]
MILPLLVLAATADLQVFSVTPSKTAVMYDETFRVTARVRNAGPDAAPDTVVSIGGNAPGMVLSVEAPAGWTCRGPGSSAVECRTPSFAAGAEAELSVMLTAPQPTPIEYRVGANINGFVVDPSFSNNSLNVDMELLHPQRHSDLAVTVALERNPIPEGGEVRATFDVRNEGPDDAHDVVVAITPIGDSTLGNIFAVTASGAGWNCIPAGENVLCSRPELRAGMSAPILVRGTAPAREARLSIDARVRAEANRDSVNGNNIATPSIAVGSAANWQRMLLPVTTEFLQGGSGAWRTEIAALILADEQPQFAHTLASSLEWPAATRRRPCAGR